MARKSSKDYRTEYMGTLLKQKKLENQIQKRCLEMCEANPDVELPLIIKDGLKTGGYTTGNFKEGIEQGMTATTEAYIDIIAHIEEHNRVNFPHVQTKLKYD